MGRLVRERDGRQVSLGAEQVVGRSSWCRFQLSSTCVSGTHARIHWSGRAWVLQDLGSRNGTLCNDSVVNVGCHHRLKSGATLVFGDRSETWTLVDHAKPKVQLVPLDSGPSLTLERDPIPLPSEQKPLATVLCRDSGWHLEYGGKCRALSDGMVVVVEGRAMVFEDPALAQLTPQLAERPLPLSLVELRFEVSMDEEEVDLTLSLPEGPRRLPRRACFYLAMILARSRLDDTAKGVEEPGWVPIARLLRDIPEYQSSLHLNVDVFRLRHSLSTSNVLDASTVIERRRGQVRIGVERLVVARVT